MRFVETTSVEFTGFPSSAAAVQIARHAAYAGIASAKGAHSARQASYSINWLVSIEIYTIGYIILHRTFVPRLPVTQKSVSAISSTI